MYLIRSQITGEEESHHDEGSRSDGGGNESEQLEDMLIVGSQEYIINSQTEEEEVTLHEEENGSRLAEPTEGTGNRVANETGSEDLDINSGNGAEQGGTAKG